MVYLEGVLGMISDLAGEELGLFHKRRKWKAKWEAQDREAQERGGRKFPLSGKDQGKAD